MVLVSFKFRNYPFTFLAEMLCFERASELCTLRSQQRNESLEILGWKRNSYPGHLFATINRVIKTTGS